jgi:hypothetical protein
MPTAAAITRITTIPIDALLLIADLDKEVDIFNLSQDKAPL